MSADAADVEARRRAGPAVRAEHELGRAAADVDDERVLERRAPRGHAAVHERRLLVAVEQTRREAVAPLDLAEERLAVLRVADGARRDRERARCAVLLELPPVPGEAVADARDRDGEKATPLVHSLAEPGDRQLARRPPRGGRPRRLRREGGWSSSRDRPLRRASPRGQEDAEPVQAGLRPLDRVEQDLELRP